MAETVTQGAHTAATPGSTIEKETATNKPPATAATAPKPTPSAAIGGTDNAAETAHVKGASDTDAHRAGPLASSGVATVNVAKDHPNNRKMVTPPGHDEPGTAPAPAPASIGGTDNAAETAHIK